jgi:hypothetical protein
MHLVVTIIFSGFLAFSGCKAPQDDEIALRMRLQEYARYWADQRYDRVWKMMSPRLREGNGNDKAKFAESIRNSGFILVELQPQKITVQGQKALVVTLTKFFSKVDNKVFENVDEEHWVKIKGEWYFDNYRTIK